MPVAVPFSPFTSLKGCEGFTSSMKMLPRSRPLPSPPPPCKTPDRERPHLPVRPLPDIPSIFPRKRPAPTTAPVVSKLPAPIYSYRRARKQISQPPTIRPLLLPTPPASPDPFKPRLPSRLQFIHSIEPKSPSSLPNGSRCPLCYNSYRASIVRAEPPVILGCGHHVGRDCLLRYVNRVEPSGRYSSMCPLPSCTELHDLFTPTYAMLPVIVVTEPDESQDGTYMYDEWVFLGEIDESELHSQLFEAWETILRVRAQDIRFTLKASGLDERRVMDEILFTIMTSLVIHAGVTCIGRDLFRGLVKDVWQTIRTMTDIPEDREPWEWVLLLARLVVTKFILLEYHEDDSSEFGF